MSAFLISNETYQTISNTLEYVLLTATNEVDTKYLVKRAFRGIFDCASVESVIRRMYEENIQSVNWRYNKEEPSPELILKRFTFAKNDKIASWAQLFKHLECWVYQSCERPDEMRSAVFVQVTQFKDKLACILLSETAEYKAADWG